LKAFTYKDDISGMIFPVHLQNYKLSF